MKRLALVIAFLVLSAQTGSLCAQGPGDRGALIREIINRSRLLEDAYFRLPRSVWRRFVVDDAKGPAPAPVSSIRSRGVYRLKIDGQGVAGVEAEIHLLVFDARGAGAIPVLPNSLAWSEISLAVGEKDAKAAPYKPATLGKWLVYRATEPGYHVIRARGELKGFKASGGTFTLPVIRTVQTAVTLDSPRAFEVSASGAARMAAGTEEKGTHVALPLRPASKLVLTYRPLQRRTDRQAAYQVSGAVAWNFGPAARQVSADLRIAILAGKSEGLEITLPPTARRVAVSGPDVREVRTDRGAVSVFFRGAISGRTRLKLDYELPAANGVVSLGRPEIRSGRWAGGTLVITNTAGSSEIQPAAMSGLKEIALSDIPRGAAAILAGKAVLAYSITSAQWSARAESMNLGEFAIKQTIADSARYQFAYRPDGTVICRADYEIRNRNRQFLRITLPAGAKMLLARVSEKSRPMTLLPGLGKTDEYLLPLERSTASVMGLVSFPVQVVYMYRSDALTSSGRGTVALPRIDVPIAYAWCQANMPGGMRRVEFSGVMRPVEQYSSETALASLTYGTATALDPERKRLALPEAQGALMPGKGGGGGGGGVLGWLLGSKNAWAKGEILAHKGPVPMLDKPTTVKVPAGGTILLGGRMGTSPAGSLSRNYWRAGQESYKQGKYDDADKALSKVIELSPDSPDAPNAKRLLANIKLLKGKLKVKSQSEKAAAVTVKQQISASNTIELQQQSKLVEEGIQAAKQKDTKRAQALFQAAEALGQKLVARGENVIEQEARLRIVRDQLDIAQKTASENLGRGLKQVKQLRQSGRIVEAGALADKLARSVDELSNTGAGITFELQKEREQLALESAKETLQQTRVVPRRNQVTQQRIIRRELTTGLWPGDDPLGTAPRPDSNMDGRRRPAEKIIGGQFLDDVQADFVRSATGTVVKVYKVGDLVTALSDAEGKDGLEDIAGKEADRGKRTSKLTEQVQSLLKDAKNGKVQVTTYGGQRAFVVKAGAGEQEAVSKLIEGLRKARGPQVEVGSNLALQRGLQKVISQTKDGSWSYRADQSGTYHTSISVVDLGAQLQPNITGGTIISGKQPQPARIDPDLQSFIAKNYGWQGKAPDTPPYALGARANAWDAAGNAKRLDAATPQGKSVRTVLTLKNADAASVAAAVTQMFTPPRGGGVRRAPDDLVTVVAEKNSNSIIVTANPKNLAVVKTMLAQLDESSVMAAQQVFIVPLKNVDAVTVASIISNMYKQHATAARRNNRSVDPLTVQADKRSNALIVSASGEMHTQVMGWVKQIDAKPKTYGGRSQAETEMDRVVHKQLDTRVSKLDFEDMEISQVIQFLRDVSGANIHVRWRALAAEGVKPATTVNVHLSNVTFTKALETILDNVAAGGKKGLGYVVNEGVITISTKSDLGKQTVVRVYDIRDMIADVPMFEGPKLGRSTRRAGDKSGDETGLFDPGAGGSDTGSGLEGDLKSRSEIISEIKTLIAGTVDRDSWRDAGGEAGAVSEIGGQLVITQTKANHAKAAKLIAKLRKTKGLKAADEGESVDALRPVETDPIVRKQLDTKVAKLDFEDMELSHVFQFLRDVSGANIHVKWRALALESIESKTTVNVHLSNVTFRKALKTILEDAAAAGESRLDYVVDKGVITVSTPADLDRQTVIHIYDIRDMIAAGAGRKGGLESRNEVVAEIKTLITDTIDRDSWRDAGGEAGAVSVTGGQLIVTQTLGRHASIAALITRLRRGKGLKGPLRWFRVAEADVQMQTEMDRITKKLLDTKVAKLDFEDMELDQVFQFLRDVSGANIHVRWRALALESIEKATTVNVHLSNVTFRQALQTVLQDVATGGEPGVGETGLSYVIDDGVITISTKANLGTETVVGVYDIRDMIVAAMGREGDLKSRGEIVGEIMALITDTIDRDSWRDAGGEAGAISELGGQLITTQTIESHAKIRALINALRKADGIAGPVKYLRADKPGRTAEKLLDKRVSKLDFEDMELEQVIQFLGDVSGAKILVKWRALALESIEKATTVNLHLSNVTFRKALETVLKDVATGGEPGVGKTGLGYVVDDGGITISTNSDLRKKTVVRTYDIQDIITLGTGLDGGFESHRDTVWKIRALISDTVDRDSWKDAGGETGSIMTRARQLIITQGLMNHAKIAELLNTLRRAGGLETHVQRDRPGDIPDRRKKHRSITAGGKLDAAELARALRFNRGQKTQVASLNLNVDAAAAGSLGIKFHEGNNDVSFTVVDEAQFRTLMELDAATRSAGHQVDPNETRQDTIVGTDALLANEMTTYVTHGRDRGNTLDIADNPISLSHEKYVLIDNNGYLTAVRAGEMQHWQEASKPIEFVQAPQTIEIPRVGELVKLEKTLVKPGDEMVVRFDYQWKGK